MDLTQSELFEYIKEEASKNILSQTFQTIHIQQDFFSLFSAPIMIKEQLMGYCSFIYTGYKEINKEISCRMIEKVASVCSLCLFYEKAKLDSYAQMKSFLLNEIMSGHFSSKDEMIAKASLYHLDLTQPFYLGMIGYTFTSSNFQNELEISNEIMSAISQYFIQQKQYFLMNQVEHHINLFVTDEFNKNKNVFFGELIQFLHGRFPGSDFYMGISKNTKSILDAPNAYKEALASKRMVTKNKQIIFFDTLGVVGTLINQNNENDVRMMVQSLLGNIQLDCQKNIDLIQTLYSFLLNGGNLEKTAEELSLSISGLRYRINKIEELLQMEIRSPIISCQLLMSIQALIILGDLDIHALVV
jgi:PucR family transcriptional regulator, purine catabolism regulatory protein